MGKKTIAILGDTGRFSPGLMEALMMHDLRLLFISEDETKKSVLKQQFDALPGVTEVEFISCEREGCWEADIIAISPGESFSTELIQKIREVATQKIVLVISDEHKTSHPSELVTLLPNSKVIEIQFNNTAKVFSTKGNDLVPLTDINTIFENAGYKNR